MDEKNNGRPLREQFEEYLKSIGAERGVDWSLSEHVAVHIDDDSWTGKVYIPESETYPVDQLRARGYTLESLKRFAAMVKAEAGSALLRQAIKPVHAGLFALWLKMPDGKARNDLDAQLNTLNSALADGAGQSLLDELQQLKDQVAQCKAAFTRGIEAEGAARTRADALEEQVQQLTKERDLLIQAVTDARAVAEADEAAAGPAEARLSIIHEILPTPTKAALNKLKEESTNG